MDSLAASEAHVDVKLLLWTGQLVGLANTVDAVSSEAHSDSFMFILDMGERDVVRSQHCIKFGDAAHLYCLSTYQSGVSCPGNNPALASAVFPAILCRSEPGLSPVFWGAFL
jgi:hypothetical protein